jgi:Ni/Co efflux regulator RcnB
MMLDLLPLGLQSNQKERTAMRKSNSLTQWILTPLIAGMLAAGPVYAEKPSSAGDSKHDKREKGNSQNKGKHAEKDNRGSRGSIHFADQHRVVIREYYGEQHRKGKCPPGLAKKNNGCMPPGQAKKWHIGRPLPRDVIFYELPPAVVVKLGRPPAGHRYVRVAADILLIAVGTAMVVDAIQDLSRM